jgi:hypothetical protein
MTYEKIWKEVIEQKQYGYMFVVQYINNAFSESEQEFKSPIMVLAFQINEESHKF